MRFSREYIVRFGHAGMVAESPAAYAIAQGKFTENLIQLIWRNGLYDGSALYTVAGLPVTVHTAGRFNTGAGPDFKNADITIGGLRLRGDVEIHKHAREWFEHKHHLSPLYNHTALHVFMERGDATPAATTRRGRTLHELDLGLHLRHPLEELHRELEVVHAPLTGRPFNPRCTPLLQKLGPGTTLELFNIIGDGRALIKSNRVIARLTRADPEQVFYELLFETMGYSVFNRQFGAVARAMPRARLLEITARNPAIPPAVAACAALFRVAGFPLLHDGADAKAAAQAALMTATALPPVTPIFGPNDWPLAGCRPANFPQRRIAALAALVAEGFSAAGLQRRFAELPLDATTAQARKFARGILGSFTGVADPYWDSRYAFAKQAKSPKKIIGADKAVSIAADCLIPFLLAVSRAGNDLDMEQRLVLFYHALPIPSSSAVLDFMRKTVLGRDAAFTPRSVCHQQALLQVYKDFCHAAPAACVGCPFVEYLKTLGAAQASR